MAGGKEGLPSGLLAGVEVLCSPERRDDIETALRAIDVGGLGEWGMSEYEFAEARFKETAEGFEVDLLLWHLSGRFAQKTEVRDLMAKALADLDGVTVLR
jgi:hypothetical protein